MEIFLISNNLENRSYMISCNPVKALGKILYFHLYMISNNSLKGSLLDIISFTYDIL